MIILTGASGGIGRAVLPDLAIHGDVIGIYHSTKPDIPARADLDLVQLDISQERDIQKFIVAYKSKLKRIMVLHCAARSIDNLAVKMSESEWNQVHDVNLKGDFMLSKALIPIMIHENWGRLIHVSSVVGLDGVPGTAAYAASKSGLIGLSKVFAREYARFNITSNVLNLGYFQTGLIDSLNPDKREAILNRIPSGRLGRVSNVVNAIDFLKKSDYVNGAVINIDGGY